MTAFLLGPVQQECCRPKGLTLVVASDSMTRDESPQAIAPFLERAKLV